MGMITLALLMQNTIFVPPPPPPITQSIPAVEFSCVISAAGKNDVKIAGRFDGVIASVQAPVSKPKPRLVISSDDSGRLMGEYGNSAVLRSTYFSQVIKDPFVYAIQFEFGDYKSPGSIELKTYKRPSDGTVITETGECSAQQVKDN